MRVSALTGALLDYWTGRADGTPANSLQIRLVPRTDNYICVFRAMVRYDPSSNPSRGWPILHRLGIRTGPYRGGWEALYCGRRQEGANALEAAMRVFVCSVYGDTVPDEDPTGAPVFPIAGTGSAL